MKKANKSESQQGLGRLRLGIKKVTLRDLDDYCRSVRSRRHPTSRLPLSCTSISTTR